MPRIVRRDCDSCYHVVSRVNGREFLLRDVEKEAFVDLLWRVAGFCGVKVLAFAILDNHFHLLVEVPAKVGELSDEALLDRAQLLYGKERRRQPLSLVRIARALQAGGAAREGMRSLLLGRMASLPMFVKILKQRFSISFNLKYGRSGTLWEDRFHSVLVENAAIALRTVAAYIDLNPVRAGIVDDPKDYRFSGYGAAAGSKGGVAGYGLFRYLKERFGDGSTTLASLAGAYRKLLYIKGSQGPRESVFTAEEVRKVLATGGNLSTAQLLRCRLHFLTAGAVIGSRAFVENFISARKRKRGRVKECPNEFLGEGDLHALRAR
ncbi:MAG: transposase [Opitutales bacterium]|nr:transposase [Opitutales bacterium]